MTVRLFALTVVGQTCLMLFMVERGPLPDTAPALQLKISETLQRIDLGEIGIGDL